MTWLPDVLIRQSLSSAAAEQREFLSLSPAEQRDANRQCLAMLINVAVLLTLQQYSVARGNAAVFLSWPVRLLPQSCGDIAAAVTETLLSEQNAELTRMTCWAVGSIAVYTVLPILTIRLTSAGRLRDFGFRFSESRHWWYLAIACYLGMLPAVFIVSQTRSFLAVYPFYRLDAAESLWPRFLVWELLYAAQFVSLEFFFRGYIIQTGRRQFGAWIILISMIPYCMIHFSKPMAETLGAIGAGMVLGFISLSTRSLWIGAALHISVAWTMDALALLSKR